MNVLNKEFFERWILHLLSHKSSRHLMFDFNERLITEILNLYRNHGSKEFLSESYLWVFTDGVSDHDYLSKEKVSRINDADLIEVRNTSEDNSFLVLISSLAPVIIPSDSIASVCEKYLNAQSSFIEFVCSEVFIDQFNIEKKIVNEFKNYLLVECGDNLDYSFYKKIDEFGLYDFFGIIGNSSHFNFSSFKDSSYFKKFIERIQFVLETESFKGLEEKLSKSSVTNCNITIEEFKKEGYISAKEFSRNICNVFLRQTEKYGSLIDVDQWIVALSEDVEEDSIQFDDKNLRDLYSIVKVKGASSAKRSYILGVDRLLVYLSSRRETDWLIDRQAMGKGDSLEVLQNDKLVKITSNIDEEKKSISLINYHQVIPEANNLDFGIRVKDRYTNDKDLKILSLEKPSQIEEVKNSLKNISISVIDYNEVILKGIDSFKFNLYEIKDKRLFANSDLDLSLRLINKETVVEFLLLEDENFEFKINCDGRSEIESKVDCTNFHFKDINLFLQNISLNRLFIKLNNDGVSEWIVIQFSPQGSKEPIIVKNYFQKYQALNDSSIRDRVVSIESKPKNDIHSFYFEDKYECSSTYLPTIFNLEDQYALIYNSETNPYFLDVNKWSFDLDFRPKKKEFDNLIGVSAFEKYLECRNEIAMWYKSKFLSYDVRSIDDIDFSSDDIYYLSLEYLSLFNDLFAIDPITIWLDTFYFCEVNLKFKRLENMPSAVFFSPYNPILIFQLATKMRKMRNTVEKAKKPNSISSLLKRNILECWILKVQTQQECYFSIDTDSTLFTGFVSEKDLYENTLEPTLKKFNVTFSQGIGHLSSSQIKSALNKSYSYLSNKSTFNIKVEGKLVDNSANDSILDWVEMKSLELSNLYANFNLQVNVFDNRDELCYPNDNLLAYYKEEKKLNFNWYKGVSGQRTFDLTLITSFIPDTTTFNQKDSNLFSNSFSYKDYITTNLSVYKSNAIYRDLFFKKPEIDGELFRLIGLLNACFKNDIPVNQTRTLLKNNSFNDSEVVAISSDVSNSYILEEVVGKTLWEFSIADYSFRDSGKGDYFLIANEQDVYVSNFKKFLNEIDPVASLKFEDILVYSKRTGLFELKHLISNQNFIKGFIASVAARKIIDNIIRNSADTFVVPYDVFKNRLQKVKMEVDPEYKESGTQYPDFILCQISNESGKWIFDLRLIEIKYRNLILVEDEISKILSNQTDSVRKIFCTLNSWRAENESNYGLWVETLSILLTEMAQFYFNNTLEVSSELKLKFSEAINQDYIFRVNDSLLIALDNSDSVVKGSAGSGFYIKIPQSQLNIIFSEDISVMNGFIDFFYALPRLDSCPINFSDLTNSSCNYFPESIISPVPLEPLVSTVNSHLCTFEVEVKTDSVILDEKFSENNSTLLSDLNILFGRDKANRDVFYYPKGKGSSPLPNYNIMVTGSSGKGKTQFIKSFIFQQGRKGSTFTIIDFKNDYSDNEFCEISKLKKVSVKLQGIPYNPLIPRLVTDEDTGLVYYDVSEHINAICSVLKATFSLGDQQEAQLKKAVREVYRLSGLDTKGTLLYKGGMVFPSFNEVGEYINSGDKDLIKLYNRLDPLFDLNLFNDNFKNIGFDNVINESYVIKVADIQNDQIKNAIAKLILVSAHGYYLGSEHKSNVSKYFVFDEAHRILDTEFVEKFIRECRAFGVGVLLSSQQPDDFPDEVLGQLATKVIHGNEGVAKLTKKIKSLISFDGDDHLINNLKTFEAIVNNQDYKNHIIQTLAWPHLIVLLSIRVFDNGGNLDELTTSISSKGVKVSELPNLLNSLEKKGYVKNENGIYKVCSDVI